LVAYLRDSLVSLGVDVFLNQRATIEEVRAFSPDAVLVATGARPVLPDIPGIKCQHVVGAWDVLRGEVVPGSKVVVLGGGAVGGEVALYIASMGTIDGDTIKFLMTNKAESPEKIWELATRGMKEVVILEKGRAAGQGIGNSTRWILLQELRRLGVEVCTSTTALAIEADGVIVAGAEGQRVKIPADTVVVAAGCRADNSLYQELSREFSGVYLIGDAQAPRKAFDAIREGFMTGNIV
jgi:2,4-dienoyl-CoA reductase (NADPH2)